jgi:hypothetical protein
MRWDMAVNSPDPTHSTDPQFVLSNDVINQSLDMLVIFKVYFQSKMDEECFNKLREQIITFLGQQHDGTQASPEVLSIALNKKLENQTEFIMYERINALKHLALIGCASWLINERVKHGGHKAAFLKFIDRTLPDMTLDEYNAALRVLYHMLYNQHYDPEHSASGILFPQFFDEPYDGYRFSHIDFIPVQEVFESKFMDLEPHILQFRDRGRFIDTDYNLNGSRLKVRSQQTFEVYKKEGEDRRQAFRESLENQHARLPGAGIRPV